MPTDAEILDQWFADYGHGRLTQYEDAAEAFYRDTGLMAPGKSEPMGWAGLHSQEERSERWEAWCKARADARMSAVARLRADLAAVTAERDRLRDVLADPGHERGRLLSAIATDIRHAKRMLGDRTIGDTYRDGADCSLCDFVDEMCGTLRWCRQIIAAMEAADRAAQPEKAPDAGREE